MSLWYRRGNIEFFFLQGDAAYYDIEYLPCARSSIVRYLSIGRKKQPLNDQIVFLIEGTGFGNTLLRETTVECYPQHRFTTASLLGNVEFIINDECDLERLTIFFHALNKKEGFALFTDTLVIEIKNVVSYLHARSTYQSTFTHLIPTENPMYENDSLNRSAFKKLYEKKTSEHVFLRQLKKLLSKGVNPNQSATNGGMTIFHTVIYKSWVSTLKVMLAYGLNPFFRGGSFYMSALEWAIWSGRPDCLNIMIDSLSTIEKPIQKIHIDACVFHHLDETWFQLSNNITIRTQYKITSELTEAELDALFNLHKHYFEVPDDIDCALLKNSFKNDLTGKNKFIDIVYADKIIGYNLFQLVPPAENDNRLTLYFMYSFMHPDYRYIKLTRLLAFRPAYSLQLLFPAYTIVVFALAVSVDGHRLMACNEDYFPKYIPDNSKKYVGELLGVVAPGSQFIHHGISNYVIDTVRAKKSGTVRNTIENYLFTEHILDPANQVPNQVQAATCYFVVSGKNLLSLNQLCVTLQLGLIKHLMISAKQLSVLIEKMKTCDIKSTVLCKEHPYADHRFLFWCNKRMSDSGTEELLLSDANHVRDEATNDMQSKL